MTPYLWPFLFLGDPLCDARTAEEAEALLSRQMPRLAACHRDSDCTVVEGICGVPLGSHAGYADCTSALSSQAGSVLDCLRFDGTWPAPVCTQGQCRPAN